MISGAYRDPADELHPWVVLNIHWMNTVVKPVVEFDGALPSCDIGWLNEIEEVPREGIYRRPKAYIG